ncbi:beta-lactamase class A CARB-1 [Desulfoluna spongiiphila]|uniref:Beta-lactamase n=1 Tax=Desulfoluna spongiiphila TaxID=419481 RepID=A0A1G5H0N4_9BACT|nr:class A beta-lactamase [Desulfoluna spongiiphila]SCY57217.1 beta-lactamase class A CARB-1 [Desulfoluna spongiiphila]
MKLLKLTVLLLAIGYFSGCIAAKQGGPAPQNAPANGARYTPLENRIKEIEHALGARVGVSLYEVETSESWSYKGDIRFPLMSTFKTLACAKTLLDVEQKKVSFDDSVVIEKTSLITWSPVTKHHAGQAFSLKQACAAMMIMSDNTAANIVLDKTGGPTALTAFMRSIGDAVTRLDRMEPELGEALEGDVRDTTTPNAMADSLHVLLFGDVLSKASKTQLTQWMRSNKISGSLLRSVLPDGWTIADRSGAGGHGSRGITAVVWPETQPPFIVCVYLTQTKASFDERNKAIAEIGRELFKLYE